MITTLLTVALAFGALVPSARNGPVQALEASSNAGPCALAPSLSEALRQRFGSALILKPSDLYEDERGLFNAEHRGACPGMATGRFFGPTERPAIAIVLLGVGPKRNSRLVVARPALTSWAFIEVGEMDQGSTAVVWREGKGVYRGPEEPRILSSKNDVVILRAYDAWKRAYIWNGRTFDAIQLYD